MLIQDNDIKRYKYEETQFFCGEDNQALFGKGFDITLSYGDAKGEGSYNACTQTLVGCYITSYRQAFDTSGEPILDMYTFTAKDLVLNTDLVMETLPEQEDPNAHNDWSAEKEDQVLAYELMIISDNINLLESECEKSPETIGVYANPLYNYVDGSYSISSMITTANKEGVELEDVSVVIEITDIAYDHSIKKFNLSLVSKESLTYECKLKGTETQAGSVIKKLFDNGTVSELECELFLKCKYQGKEFDESQRLYIRSGSVQYW